MNKMLIITMVLVTGWVMTLHAQTALTPDNVPRMTIEELKQQINNPNLVVIDVRTSHDWESSTTKIKGSIREDASKAASWIDKYPPGKTLVFYCA
jgi:rhodanese-related sulfurtransferase